MAFDIPIELFLGFIASTFIMAIIGLIRNPQIPALVAFAGVFMLVFAVSTDNIIMGYSNSSSNSSTYYNVDSFTGSVNINAVQQSIYAENVVDSSSQVYNKAINCAQWTLKKSGSPPLTSSIIFGVWDSSGNLKYSFGDMNVTYLQTNSMPFQLCNTGLSYTTVVNDRIGIRYNGGNATNTVQLAGDGNNPYDDGHTIANLWTGSSWTTSSTLDLTGVISYVDNTATSTAINYSFTALPKALFGLFATILILAGALMIYKE